MLLGLFKDVDSNKKHLETLPVGTNKKIWILRAEKIWDIKFKNKVLNFILIKPEKYEITTTERNLSITFSVVQEVV